MPLLTPNLSLQRPSDGEYGWGAFLRNNMDILDAKVGALLVNDSITGNATAGTSTTVTDTSITLGTDALAGGVVIIRRSSVLIRSERIISNTANTIVFATGASVQVGDDYAVIAQADASLQPHISSINNPHAVTAEQLGLSSTGMPLQVVGKTIATKSVQTITGLADNQVGAGIDFIMDIIPKGDNSKFLVEFRWFGEVANTEDVVFNVHRDGIRINNNGTGGHGLSMACTTHAAASRDNNSTPEIMYLRTYDQVPSVAGVSIAYTLIATPSSSLNITMTTNRTIGDLGVIYETGVSEIIITEIAA